MVGGGGEAVVEIGGGNGRGEGGRKERCGRKERRQMKLEDLVVGYHGCDALLVRRASMRSGTEREGGRKRERGKGVKSKERKGRLGGTT